MLRLSTRECERRVKVRWRKDTLTGRGQGKGRSGGREGEKNRGAEYRGREREREENDLRREDSRGEAKVVGIPRYQKGYRGRGEKRERGERGEEPCAD